MMIDATAKIRAKVRYSVYHLSAFGSFALVADFDAETDAEALRKARALVPNDTGELRHGFRVVCRFGRA